MNSEEIKAKIALLRGQGNQVDLAGVLADVLEAIIDTPAPPANDPRIVGEVSAANPATFGTNVRIASDTQTLGTVTIGNDVSIGQYTEIEQNVKVRHDTEIGHNTSIGNGVRVGDNVVIGNNLEIDCPVLGTNGGFMVNKFTYVVGTEDLIITTPEGTQRRITFSQ